MGNDNVKSKYIIIVGCGRLGSRLANILSNKGNYVVVIDKDERTFSDLSPDFSGFRVTGNAAELSVLSGAKLDKAEILIAATHSDNLNLMVAQVARNVFNVPHVLARLFDPNRDEVYAELGIDTICPTVAAADMFLSAMTVKVDVGKGGIK